MVGKSKCANLEKVEKCCFWKLQSKSAFSCKLKKFYRQFSKMVDDREEWDKDIWDIRNLEMYGLTYNKTLTGNYLNFKSIGSFNIRNSVKRYLKQRLITGNLNFATGRVYVRVLSRFLTVYIIKNLIGMT